MTPTDDQILEAMDDYGGSFVRVLAALYRRADEQNRARIQAAWPEYWTEYAEIAAAQIAREAERDEAYERAAARARDNDFEDTGGKDWT